MCRYWTGLTDKGLLQMAPLTPLINNRNNPQFNNPGRGMRFAWNVLITGANGFIGKALCERLLAHGYQVRGAVRCAAQMTAIPSWVEGALVGDIGPKTDWSEALDGIDGVVHLAAKTNPPADNNQTILPISAQGTFG